MAAKNSLKKATGKVPARSKTEFSKILDLVIEQWDLNEPVDVMMANRMVSTWMKMRHVEDCIKNYGMFFEVKDKSGDLKGIKVNELAYLLKQMEADFRSYYRLLNVQKPAGKESLTIIDLLKEDGDKPKKTKK